MSKSNTRKENRLMEFDLNSPFIFEKGKHKSKPFKVSVMACDGPTCDCQNMYFMLESIGKDTSGEPAKKYTFGVKIFEEELEEDLEPKLSASVKSFAESFLEELTQEDWVMFQNSFHTFKKGLVEHCNVSELEAEFPDDEIENKQILIGYFDIFPFCRKFIVERGDYNFLVDDRYCLNSNCKCHNAVFVLLPLNQESYSKNDCPTIQYDYKKRKWEIIEKGKIDCTMEDLSNDITESFPDLPKTLKKRHQQLKIMYKNYRIRNGLYTKDPIDKTTARNAPCPCGSGKKYKRCCGKDPIT